MKELVDNLILRWGHDPASWPITQAVYLLAMLLVGMALTTFGAIFAGLLSWWERRIAARMQSRIGPNRVGPGGLLQFLADALKLIGKEDLIPSESDNVLFRIAPYFVMTGFVLTFVDGVSSVDNLIDASGLPRLEMLRILSDLVAAGVLSVR